MFGTVLAGKYRILEPLGAGGMGTVWEAEHAGTGRHVAVKLLSNHSNREIDMARFEAEARALGELEHPSIVDVLDFGVDGAAGVPYLVMELLSGEGLDSRFSHRSRVRDLGLAELAAILEPVARALDFAHERGIVHRDVKPSNIFISRTADGAKAVKLLDFGLATTQDLAVGRTPISLEFPVDREAEGSGPQGRLTQDGTVVGTPHYIAPEVAMGERASPASDRYALAVVAFEALSGFPPFPGSKFHDIVTAAVTGTGRRITALRPDLPSELEATFSRALSAEPAERPRTAVALVEELRRVADLDRERREATRRAQEERVRRSRQSLAAFLLAAAVAAGCSALASTPLLRGLEGRTIDARLALLPTRPPALDLIFLIIDEATLAADPTPLALQADRFAGVLEGLFDAGARTIAVDFLLPSSWAESPAFSRAVRVHAGKLTLAAFARSDGSVTGHEAISGLTTAALGPQDAGAVFGLVNLEEDVDGFMRRARPFFADWSARPREAFAARLARLSGRTAESFSTGSLQTRLIDGRIRWQESPVISWKDVRRLLEEKSTLFSNRSVVIGGDFEGSGDDFLKLPSAGGRRTSGVFIQGLVAQTFASSEPLSETPATTRAVLTAAAALAAFGAIFLTPLRLGVSIVGCSLLFYLLGAFSLVSSLGLVIPVASVLLAGAAGAAAGGLTRAAGERRAALPPGP